MADEGLATGFDDGNFRPGDPVDRQSVAAFLHRLIYDGAEPLCTAAPFPDVPMSHLFCTPITWLVENEVAAGYPDGTFRPTTAVTRQELAAFLYRANQIPN